MTTRPHPSCPHCEEAADATDAFCRACGHGLMGQGDFAAELHQTLVETVPVGVFTADPNGRLLFWNRAMEEQTGLRRRDALGRVLFDVLPCLQPHQHRVARVMDTALPIRLDQVAAVSSMEPERTASFWFAPMLLESGVATVVGVMEDITQKIRVDNQLIRSERLAAIGELAAGIAHNFNNIMAAIGGDAQLLKIIGEEEGLPGHVLDAAQQIHEETMRGGRIAHDLLSFARGAEPQIGRLDVRETVQDAVRLIRNHPAARGSEIVLDLPKVPPMVEADANQLHQVFFNLILNGLQAMPQGGILTVGAAVRGHDRDPHAGQLDLKFHDTGAGIPPDRLRRIFDPFYSQRANGTTGSGLGLPVSLSMIKSIGGDIQITSAVGIGTTVTVSLPIVERRHGQRSLDGSSQGALRTSRGRVLLVDDDPYLRRTLNTLFNRRGFEVVTATDTDEALLSLDEARTDDRDAFSLVLTELLLPRRDGLDLIRAAQKHDPHLPVVVLTGATETEQIHAAMEAGARFAFSKPPSFTELLWVVENLARSPLALDSNER